MKARRTELPAVVTSVMLLVWSGCSFTSGTPEAAPDVVCKHRLERIGKMIARYRQDNGKLPPSAVSNEAGQHSWRTLIAAHLPGDDPRQPTYQLDEPWNSPHNRKWFTKNLPGQFTCPLESDQVFYPYTSYLMLKRSDDEANLHLADDAVLVVESVSSRVETPEPRDIEFDELFEGESPFGVGKLNSLHGKSVRALRVDGKVIEIPKDIGREALRELLNGSRSN